MGKSLRVPGRVLRLPRQWGYEVLNMIVPAGCPGCGAGLTDAAETLCATCWGQLQENLSGAACPMCGHDSGPYGVIEGRCRRCQNRRPVVSHVVRVGDYSRTLRELILAFKFRRQSQLDGFLGSLLGSAILGDAALASVDLIVPIPLHWRRLWERRYNQADLLARSAAREFRKNNRPIAISDELVRVRYTEPQASLAMRHRLINLHGAFAVRARAAYQGKHVCLIDDVTTTGTTLRVAAHTLKQAGAARVSAAVLAVAAND